MSDDDLIRRGDALAAIQLGDTVTKLQARIRAIPYVDAEPVCTGCGGTGIAYQTERRCACQGPDLTDPVAVHVNMLRGTIAKPTVEQIIHLYGREAFQPMIDVAIAKALEKACLAVSEHADWPEDEHGRTEQVGLFARVINAIRAITPTDAAHVNETPKTKHDADNVLTDAAQAGAPFFFDRYINGVRMAEDVCIERETTLEGAMQAAVRIAAKGPKGEAPVLVYRAPTDAAQAPAEDAHVKGETAGQMLERLGMDGVKWAAEFRTTALRLGYSDMDEGWLIGWFCNAIMAGYDRSAAQAREAALAEAAAAWEAFKAATTSADHFAAVDRLDAILRAMEGRE